MQGHISQPEKAAPKSKLLRKRPFRRMSSEVLLELDTLHKDYLDLDAQTAMKDVTQKHTFLTSPLEPSQKRSKKRQ